MKTNAFWPPGNLYRTISLRVKVDGFAELPGKTVRIRIGNAPAGQWWTQACAFVEGYGTLNGKQYYELDDGKTPTCGLTREQAVQAGDELIAALEEPDLVCVQIKGIMFTEGEPYAIHNSEDDSTIPVEDKEGGYELTYRRKVEGLPISVTPDAASSDGNGFWNYEEVTVAVADQGVVFFTWDSPYETPTVTSYAQELISFQEATEIFAKMMMVTHQNRQEINQRNGLTIREHYDIDRVRLDYVRIRDKDNLEEGTLIPVWNFWGVETDTDDMDADRTFNGVYTVQLTVNALDGSVINIELGY